MKTTLQLEELAMLVLGIYLFSLLSFPWWLFLALFLVPDIGMLGYLVNKKIGALTYNIFHHKGLAIFLYCVGIYLSNEHIQLCGIILFSHAAFDRILGYGLKYEKGFKFTHLGEIGKKN
ncbi:DUF4260 domain-containing protein [Aquimarina rubra]|uniref:DUF4260 domain-containing protein n=1 Tax=Aquimarina rubra TaxID=1920033 RepID=A0ABW5LE95_9FLAO